MHTLLDYLKEKGDISFLEEPLNEVDSLIFCAFSYFSIENMIRYEEKITLQDLYRRFIVTPNDAKPIEKKLFTLLSESKRFQDVYITLYFNEVDTVKEMQIAGVTFLLPNAIFVAFKGTDGWIGWKEDFHLSYQKSIPSQQRARVYLEEVLSKFSETVYVGGHSKGGNLALYASLYCPHFERIKRIYNFDGPGFQEEFVESTLYQNRKSKMITYLPKAGIVGNLFNKDMEIVLVKSKQFGILAHDLYSWIIEDNHFLYAKVLDEQAKQLSNQLNSMIDNLSNQEKEIIVRFVYDILDSLEVPNLIAEIKKKIKKYSFTLNDLFHLKRILPVLLQFVKTL